MIEIEFKCLNYSLDLYQQTMDMDPLVSSSITDSGISETSETPLTSMFDRISTISNQMNGTQTLTAQQQQMGMSEMGHSRNSSNTSQVCAVK